MNGSGNGRGNAFFSVTEWQPIWGHVLLLLCNVPGPLCGLIEVWSVWLEDVANISEI